MTIPSSLCALYDTILYKVSARIFTAFISFRNYAQIYEALSQAFLSAWLWPSRELKTGARKLQEWRSFLQISVSFRRCRKLNLAN